MGISEQSQFSIVSSVLLDSTHHPITSLDKRRQRNTLPFVMKIHNESEAIFEPIHDDRKQETALEGVAEINAMRANSTQLISMYLTLYLDALFCR